nr:MAG TPA: hypothetical protein [Caudoviricetes sp.]
MSIFILYSHDTHSFFSHILQFYHAYYNNAIILYNSA